MSGSKFVYVTYIRITPEKLWHTLTTPEIIKQYRFGVSVESEWKPEFQAEGKSRCVFEIEPTGAAAKLTLTHSMERPDSKFIGAVSEGWPLVLSNLKSLLETGEVAIVYHRGHGD